MLRRIFSLFIPLISIAAELPALPAVGGGDTLRYVAADSVTLLDQTLAGLQAEAIQTWPYMRPHTFALAPEAYDDSAALANDWRTHECHFSLSGGIDDSDDEAASAIDLFYRAAVLFLLTRDGCYMDAIERIGLNVLPWAIASDNPATARAAAQALFDMQGLAYATDREGIYVNLYFNSFVATGTASDRYSIDQITYMPQWKRVKLRMGGLPHGRHALKVRFRVPAWALRHVWPESRYTPLAGQGEPKLVVYINGRPEDYVIDNGYIEISRSWNKGDEIYFDFSFEPFYATERGESGEGEELRVALLRGPYVYAFPESAARRKINLSVAPEESGYASLTGAACLQLSAEAAGDSAATVIVAYPQADALRQGGCPHLFQPAAR